MAGLGSTKDLLINVSTVTMIVENVPTLSYGLAVKNTCYVFNTLQIVLGQAYTLVSCNYFIIFYFITSSFDVFVHELFETNNNVSFHDFRFLTIQSYYSVFESYCIPLLLH